MGTVELKSNLIRTLEKIEDEQLLRVIYDFLKQGENHEVGEIWKSLFEDQKKEFYESYEMSENDAYLTAWDDIKKKY